MLLMYGRELRKEIGEEFLPDRKLLVQTLYWSLVGGGIVTHHHVDPRE